MQVKYFLICEHASFSNGLVNMMGIFDTMLSSEFPTTYPQLFCVSRIELQQDEHDTRYEIGIGWVSAEGSTVHDPIIVKTHQRGYDPDRLAMDITIKFSMLVFPEPDTYFAVLSANGQEQDRIPFHVKKMPLTEDEQ